jgi:hypothetical protein
MSTTGMRRALFADRAFLISSAKKKKKKKKIAFVHQLWGSVNRQKKGTKTRRIDVRGKKDGSITTHERA